MNYVLYGLSRNSILRRQLFGFFVGYSVERILCFQLTHFCFAYFVEIALISSVLLSTFSVSAAIVDVVPVRTPFQIVCPVIGRVFVTVVYFGMSCWVWNKCFSNDTVNQNEIAIFSSGQIHAIITITIVNWL